MNDKPKILKLVEKQTKKNYGGREGGKIRINIPSLLIFSRMREHIEDMVTIYGIVETEKKLGITVLGIRKTGIENIKVI